MSTRPHVFTEALSVLSAGEVQVAVEVEVVRGELSDPHDGLLTVVLDVVSTGLALILPDQTLLQTGDNLALRVDVLQRVAQLESDPQTCCCRYTSPLDYLWFQ